MGFGSAGIQRISRKVTQGRTRWAATKILNRRRRPSLAAFPGRNLTKLNKSWNLGVLSAGQQNSLFIWKTDPEVEKQRKNNWAATLDAAN